MRKNEERVRELSIIERVVRVEEEIKSLREIESARFEAIDKRFDALQREKNARFEAVDRRLNFMQWFIGAGFIIVSILIALFGLYRGKPFA